MRKFLMMAGILFIVSCRGSYKIINKNMYKVGGEKYLECTGNEYYKRCSEETTPVRVKYGFIFENKRWINVSEEEYKNYEAGDTYKIKFFQSLKN